MAAASGCGLERKVLTMRNVRAPFVAAAVLGAMTATALPTGADHRAILVEA